MVSVDHEGIRAGSKTGPANQELLEEAEDFTKGREVPRDSVWERERSDIGRPCILNDF